MEEEEEDKEVKVEVEVEVKVEVEVEEEEEETMETVSNVIPGNCYTEGLSLSFSLVVTLV